MRKVTRNSLSDRVVFAAAAVALALSGSAREASAVAYTWTNVTGGNSTYNWSTAANWSSIPSTPGGTPTATADAAVISNVSPSTWGAGTTVIKLDVTGVDITSLTFTDSSSPSTMNFKVSESATIRTITTNYNSNARNSFTIDAGKTLSVNTLTNNSPEFIDIIQGGGVGSTLKMIADGNNTATWNHILRSEVPLNGMTWDVTEPATMKLNRVGGSVQFLEFGSTTVRIGNAAGPQTFTVSNGGLAQRWVMRTNGTNNIIRTTANDIDMGKRTATSPAGASDGIAFERGISSNPIGNGNFGSQQTRNLLTDASGAAVAGTVTAAAYRWRQTSSEASGDGQNSTATLQYDKLGSNLTLNGGSFVFEPQGSMTEPTGRRFNDVNLFWVQSGKTLAVTGTGNITINDGFAGGKETNAVNGTAMPGRMGIYFAGGTLDTRGNLELLGPTATAGSSNSFLNDGTGVLGVSTGAINVGGNVTVRSRNASGFTVVGGAAGNMVTPPAAGPGGTANGVKADDFDLRSTTLTMNGSGTKSFEWRTDAPNAIMGALTLANFGLASFTVDTLALTTNTTVNYGAMSELFLDNNLTVAAGSVLTFGSFSSGLSEIHVLDVSGVRATQVQALIASGRITGAGIFKTEGVGFTLTNNPVAIPEPTSALVIGALGVILVGNRRRV